MERKAYTAFGETGRHHFGDSLISYVSVGYARPRVESFPKKPDLSVYLDALRCTCCDH